MNTVVSIETARQERMSDDKPSLNQGYCRVVNALAEGLASTALTSLEHRVVWAVIRLTFGWQKGKDRIAASQLAEVTGLTRQKCSSTLSGLIERGVIIREGGSTAPIKINTNTDQWEAREKRTKPPQIAKVNRKCKKGSLIPITVRFMNTDWVHTKDRKDIYRNTSYSLSSGSVKQIAPSRKKKTPPPPYEEIRDLYHEILPELKECRVLSSKRKAQINARWNQTVGKSKKPCNNLDFWRRFFTYIRKCPWLMGEIAPQPGRRQFIASLEWITKEENFAKIIEGDYAPERGGE